MSLKEEVTKIREEKLAEPYTLVSYRSNVNLATKDFGVTLRYDHERSISKYVTLTASSHKELFTKIVTAPKTMEEQL